MSVPAAVFKAECLKLMDEVARTGQSVVITKHGRPVAQLTPVPPEPNSLFGYMKHTMRIKGDVVAPTGELWNAVSDAEHHFYGAALRKPRARSASLKK